ncbi:MAG: tripartite tricarboxylate transporter substrate binding protein, partial [Burkholderiaceae bacterium]|nr:tripartite tricarboxylate transporter substrate binding protein [Burkholderiaceae bacterium]
MLSPFKKATSRRQMLQTSAAVLAAPWIASHAASPVADGRTITLVVSYPAGGGADLIARLIAPKMATALGQSVVVDNKPGASGQLAAAHVARSNPDGSTLLLDASSFAVNPSLFSKLPYDTDTAFTPLGVAALFPNVLVCTASFEAKNVKDVIRLAKAKPGQLAYASSGNGSAQHLAGALFEVQANVDLLHVPYKGGGPALNDVMAGQVPLFFANVASSLGHIQSGKLRPLAVTSRRRARALPEVPTMEEAGVPGYEINEWNPVLAPSGIKPSTKTALQDALRQALTDPEVLGRIRALSGDAFADNTDAKLADFIKGQRSQWARIVRERKIS